MAFELHKQVMKRFDSFVTNYNKTPKERFSIGYLNSRADGLQAIWSEFVVSHDKLCLFDESDVEIVGDYFQQGMFANYEELYYETLGRINEKRLYLTQPPPPGTAPDPHHRPAKAPVDAPGQLLTPNPGPVLFEPAEYINRSQQQQLYAAPPAAFAHHIQIPRLNVPQFNGSYDDWPSFRDLFTAAVHSNLNLHPVHKLQYLKSLVTGTAESLLKHLPVTADNYAEAWRTLEERFDNKRALINATLRKLFSLRPVEESPGSIRQLLDNTRECLGALRVHGVDTTTWDPILIYIVSQCVSTTSLDIWEQQIPRNQQPSMEQLLRFLEDRFRALEFSAARPTSAPRIRNKPQAFHTTSSGCRLCQGPQHPLRQCNKFLEMQPAQRLNYITKAKLCVNCFAFSHKAQACRSSGTCSTCGERHHSLLHLATTGSNQANNTPRQASSAPHTTDSLTAPAQSQERASLVARPARSDGDEGVLATALVNVTAFDGRIHTFRALLDNASQENFVSRRIIQFLGVKPHASSMTISGVGRSEAPKPLGTIEFQFSAKTDPAFVMSINAIVLPVITNVLPARKVRVSPNLVGGLNLADPSYGTPGSIDILLSANVFAALTLPSVRKDPDAPTVALQTKLGWVVFGEATSNQPPRHRTCFHITSEDKVANALQEFWKVEEVVNAPLLSTNDEKCQQIYATTHTRTADGRYCVTLPFKDEVPVLGSSRDRAVSRFLQVERKLSSNPKLRDDYAKCINEYLELGHMRPVSTPESDFRVRLPNGSLTYGSYYLPHHAIIKEESTTTKLRVVFDASSKSSNGTSLNDALLIGPSLQDTLFELLIRWRTLRIVIKADIAKMYRQVLVSGRHQPFQRIIWRNSPAEPLQDFQLHTVTFGTAAAPYLAIKTLQQLANDEERRFPLGAEMLKRDFYVDDLLSGADSVPDAIEKQRQITEVLKSGGFDIRKWSSNDPQVVNDLDAESRELCSDSATLKALGIVWCPVRDTLSIKVSTLQTEISSKRALLSEVAKLFDPLGWIAPSIIIMKMVLQQLWLAGLNWDEPLPSAIQVEWTQFQRHLPSIQNITIPRWIKTSPNATFELHGFSDASEKAYAAAVYVRIPTAHNEWAVHLITAKTRVAPVKQISLPRLELCGAVLLSKLLVTVQSILKANTLHAWTDSEIVLSWLQGHPNRWATFVANRVADIHTSLDAGAWHHVPSKDNPADCASRGISPEQLVTHRLWWNGPAWLAKDSSTWPRKQKKDIAVTQLEEKRKQQSFITVATNDTIEELLIDCSTLQKAENIIVRIRRWLPRSKQQTPTVPVAERSAARHMLLRHTQRSHFADEFQHLTDGKPLSKSSKLMSLNPFIDEDQLLRVGGRLQNSTMPYDARHPVIVPRKSRLTELMILEAHKETLHGGVALMQCHLRTRYWIIDARNTIRHIIHRCNTCFRYSNPELNQIMGQLPKPRVNISTPFGHTGIDYAGPLQILLRRTPGRPLFSKGYICLFVCLATKAIHLELVGDMTTQTFLAALSRFTARRGLPSDIYSDNGTYFVRAASDIDADMLKSLKENEAAATTTSEHRCIQWHFIPPAAPHFGGLWEAGVKSTKHHLKRIVGEGNHIYEELATILCQIEACLNSRPLCPISNDPDDFETLTPGHFLIGRPICTRPQPTTIEIPTNRLDYWKRIYQSTERFWKLWQSEYLSRLQQRPKWATPTANVQVGELVLLKEDNAPPSQWKLARITELHSGTDQIVRVVTLKTPTSILKRPITKICQLPSQ